MATTKVLLDADAYLVCLQHALSTEKEEIMGLLIGEVNLILSLTAEIGIYLSSLHESRLTSSY